MKLKWLKDQYRRQRALEVQLYLEHYRRQALIRSVLEEAEEMYYRQCIAAALEKARIQLCLQQFLDTKRLNLEEQPEEEMYKVQQEEDLDGYTEYHTQQLENLLEYIFDQRNLEEVGNQHLEVLSEEDQAKNIAQVWKFLSDQQESEYTPRTEYLSSDDDEEEEEDTDVDMEEEEEEEYTGDEEEEEDIDFIPLLVEQIKLQQQQLQQQQLQQQQLQQLQQQKQQELLDQQVQPHHEQESRELYQQEKNQIEAILQKRQQIQQLQEQLYQKQNNPMQEQQEQQQQEEGNLQQQLHHHQHELRQKQEEQEKIYYSPVVEQMQEDDQEEEKQGQQEQEQHEQQEEHPVEKMDEQQEQKKVDQKTLEAQKEEEAGQNHASKARKKHKKKKNKNKKKHSRRKSAHQQQQQQQQPQSPTRRKDTDFPPVQDHIVPLQKLIHKLASEPVLIGEQRTQYSDEPKPSGIWAKNMTTTTTTTKNNKPNTKSPPLAPLSTTTTEVGGVDHEQTKAPFLPQHIFTEAEPTPTMENMPNTPLGTQAEVEEEVQQGLEHFVNTVAAEQKNEVVPPDPRKTKTFEELEAVSHLLSDADSDIVKRWKTVLKGGKDGKQKLEFKKENEGTLLLTATTPFNRQFLGSEDELLRMMIRLDAVESFADPSIRAKRKKLVKTCESMLDELDKYKQSQWEKAMMK
ncbi:hypothetical protein BD770DRAFT_389761 [Pilaira anomala]|nr:hypothetical protein BD770DRAFT_389761 [Pilaira anomala]